MTERTDYDFELWQGGICVACVTTPTLEEGRSEIMHFAAQYLQDGPVEIRGPDGRIPVIGFKRSSPAT